MANGLFSKGREGILDESIKMKTGDVRAMLVKASYVFDDTDMMVSDLGSVSNGRTTALVNKNYDSGVFDAENISLIAVDAVECGSIILFQHTGNDATARLIAFIDTPVSGLPCTPAAGQTINYKWDNGPNRIFKL
jgi:hypothetical protein